MLDNFPFRVCILFHVSHIPVHQGAGDGEVDFISLAHAHDLDVFANGGNALLEIHQFSLSVIDDILRLGEGGIANAKGGIIGGGDLPTEDVAQIRGAHPYLRIEDDVVVDIQIGEGLNKELARRFDGNGVHRDLLLLEDPCGPAGEQNIQRADDLAASKCRFRPSSHYLGFISVVVQHRSKSIKILLA